MNPTKKLTIAVVLSLIAISAHAGNWSVILTGATWHAGDGPARRHEINSYQHTVGLAYDWNEVATNRRWSLSG